ncbi:hypothetical protein [Sphingomonas sp. Root720]|uniref:hypothetical protein n=1 Tax=Sphingomonas sp. Root720 TaxID=1736595 RepID=UPI000A8E9937|nr:hypothetical protein [Sphingomonas sp. Root720]
MQLNTTQSISLGRRVHSTFGSWQRARELSVRTADGVYKLDESAVTKVAEERKAGE